MADSMSKSTQSLVSEVLGGLKGEAVFNDPSKASRLSPGLTFKDVLPAETKQQMGLAQPKVGSMVDTWVNRRPNSSMK